MERNYVESSMISSIGYDFSQGILEIEFKSNGHVWQYYDVPEYVWHEFNSASSVGKYFLATIKNWYYVKKKYKLNRENFLTSILIHIMLTYFFV
jgi:hypothetical protein